jgi:hypothetical protein
VLPAGSPQETIFSVAVEDGDAAPALVRALGREILAGSVNVEVCYCSVYEQCWTASAQELVNRRRGVKTDGSRRVESCSGMPVSGI